MLKMTISSDLFLSLIFSSLLFLAQLGQAQNNCEPSRCGKSGPEIRFPFWIKGLKPPQCGFPGFELSCRGKHTVIELPVLQGLHVKNVDYESKTIELYDPNNDCLFRHYLKIVGKSVSPFRYPTRFLSNYTVFNCSEADRGDWPGLSCASGPGFQVLVVDQKTAIDGLPLAYCTKTRDMFSVSAEIVSSDSFTLSWTQPDCGRCEANRLGCRLKNGTSIVETECFVYPKSIRGKIRKIVATVVTIGTAVLTALLVLAYRAYSSNKQEKENQRRVESFLEDYKAMKPSRYTYNDIRHITNEFKEELGEGSYGAVYRGKLSNDFFVAVKILSNAKGNNGDEFVNEVGTIGRIHHVNVVRLVGYCADGFRRALVYEFLPNGSLQSFISSPDAEHFLGWKKLQDIALGIAKGIEYLHQGCDQRILHFDIKPHNVLLDEKLTPKISDFGLAKLCSKEQSLVSMSTARGTMGYIAPEVFSRNFGKVSYKSDVYSFGVVLLEMVGGRRISDENDTTQIYYPEWIYNILEEGEDLRIRVGDEEEDGAIAKRLAIVGLWCIQWDPADRPSMKTAVHMLQGGDALTLPSNPFAAAISVGDMPKRFTNPELEAIPEDE